MGAQAQYTKHEVFKRGLLLIAIENSRKDWKEQKQQQIGQERESQRDEENRRKWCEFLSNEGNYGCDYDFDDVDEHRIQWSNGEQISICLCQQCHLL